MNISDRFYSRIMIAYIRGKLSYKYPNNNLFQIPLESLSAEDISLLFELGNQNNLKLFRFKKNRELPRVKKVLGILKGFQPENLLDVGTGRGVFLWPLLDEFQNLPVQCIDILEYRVDDINAIHDGGILNVYAE